MDKKDTQARTYSDVMRDFLGLLYPTGIPPARLGEVLHLLPVLTRVLQIASGPREEVGGHWSAIQEIAAGVSQRSHRPPAPAEFDLAPPLRATARTVRDASGQGTRASYLSVECETCCLSSGHARLKTDDLGGTPAERFASTRRLARVCPHARAQVEGEHAASPHEEER